MKDILEKKVSLKRAMQYLKEQKEENGPLPQDIVDFVCEMYEITDNEEFYDILSRTPPYIPKDMADALKCLGYSGDNRNTCKQKNISCPYRNGGTKALCPYYQKTYVIHGDTFDIHENREKLLTEAADILTRFMYMDTDDDD